MADNSTLPSSDTIRDIDRGAGYKTQVVQLDFGGAGTNPEQLATATNALPISVNAANFIFSTLNSSTAQLAAAATFTGAVETALNQPAISVLLVSDQPTTLSLYQYIDAAGTQAAGPADTWTIAAGVGFRQSVLLNGNYVKVTAQNTGASTTTTFTLNTAYGTIPAATNSDHAPVSIEEVAGVPIAAGGSIPVVQNINKSRNARIFMLDAYTAAPVAEALQNVVQWYGNAAVTATTTPAVVPAGKTLRLTSVTMSTKSLATVGSAVLRIRANTAGLAVLASPLVWSCECGSRSGATTVAMTGGTDTVNIILPDGIDLPAGTGIGFTLAGYGPTGTLTLEGVTRFVVTGFEY